MDERPQEQLGSSDDGMFGDASRARMEELIAFAQAYHGWTQREIAAFLRRDVHNMIPASGIPKADVIVRLARALDWAPGAVLEQICGESPHVRQGEPLSLEADFAELNRQAFRAFTDGRFEDMIALGLRMERVASSPEQRAEGCLRQYVGWEGMGRYEAALESLQRALTEPELSQVLRWRLRGNLAQVYFVLGRFLESEGAAGAVLDRLSCDAAGKDRETGGSVAMALYARGQALRCRALNEADDRTYLAKCACRDLRSGELAWEAHATLVRTDTFRAFSEMCRAALVCAEVLSGEVPLPVAVDRCLGRLDERVWDESRRAGLWAEANGWWSICGAEIVLATMAPGSEADHLLAVFTNKGYEIVERTGNWALRERLLMIDYLRHTPQAGRHVDAESWILDRDDLRTLAGAMARFPAFRPYGWQLWRNAGRV